MSEPAGMPLSREAIRHSVVTIVSDVIRDWDVDYEGGVADATGLVHDLGFQSIDVAMLIGELRRSYGRRDLPFEQLVLSGGRYVEEIRVGTLVDFLHRHLNGMQA